MVQSVETAKLQFVEAEGTAELPEGGKIKTYGIAVMQNGSILDCLEDITVNRQDNQKLRAILEKEEASILHFRDIVSDFVAELS